VTEGRDKDLVVFMERLDFLLVVFSHSLEQILL